jgi:hypothetical protein
LDFSSGMTEILMTSVWCCRGFLSADFNGTAFRHGSLAGIVCDNQAIFFND